MYGLTWSVIMLSYSTHLDKATDDQNPQESKEAA